MELETSGRTDARRVSRNLLLTLHGEYTHSIRRRVGFPTRVRRGTGGVILNTPQGVKRKHNIGRRASHLHAGGVHDVRHTTYDPVASLDHDVVHLIIARRGEVLRSVAVTHEKRPRSPYVISLQKIFFSQQRECEERSPVMCGASPIVSAIPIQSYSTCISDFSIPRDPWIITDQFTPATFDEAYRIVYGSCDRIVGAWREAMIVVSGCFHRVEAIEARTIEDVKDAIGVVDVPRFSMARALAAFAGLALVVALPANAVALYRTASSTHLTASIAGHAAMTDLLAAKTPHLWRIPHPRSVAPLRNSCA